MDIPDESDVTEIILLTLHNEMKDTTCRTSFMSCYWFSLNIFYSIESDWAGFNAIKNPLAIVVIVM